MKVLTISVQTEIEDFRDLFKEKAVGGYAYTLSDNKPLFEREIIYHALKNFDNVEYPLFSLSYESLLKSYFSLPRFKPFNKFNRKVEHYISALKEIGIVKVEKVESSIPLLYAWIKRITHELASNFQEIGKRLEKLEKGYFVDTNYLQEYENLNYNDIKSGKQLVSDEEINKLEKFFGDKVVPRWKYVKYFDKLLYSTCEKILEGWKENERISQFIKERNISIPSVFKARIKPPRDLIEEASLPCAQVVALLIEPIFLDDLRIRLGSRVTTTRIVSILSSYGIVKKLGGKYVLNSLHPFKIAISKLSKRMERYKKYVEALQLTSEDLSEISCFLGVPYETVFAWLRREQKPWPISYHTAQLLLKRGIISPGELHIFESYGLIYHPE